MNLPGMPQLRRYVKAALLGLLLLVSVGHASAARLALVVGNDQYQAIERLQNARNDATLIAGVLARAGFEVTRASDLGRDRFWEAIDRFKARIGKGDEVVFYFAGHGVQIGSNQVLLPVDIRAQNESQLQRDGVPLVDVLDALKDARVAVLLIDACRDNPFPRQGTRSLGANRGMMVPEPSTGQIIMMSAGRNQKALDSVPGQTTSNGLFTWELARAIQTPGQDIRAVLESVKDTVDDAAKKIGHEQRPSLVNDLRGSFSFFASARQVGGTVPTQQPIAAMRTQSAAEAEQELWNSIKDGASPQALDAYLKEFPSGRFAPQARVLIAKLSASPIPASPVAQSPQPGLAGTAQIAKVDTDRAVGNKGFIQARWDLPAAYPDSNFHTENLIAFAADVERATAGRLKIHVHANAALFKANEIKRAVQAGQAQIGEVLLVNFENENPIYGVDGIPFFATGYSDARKLDAAQRPVLDRLLSTQGLKLLYTVAWPPQGIYASKELSTIADMQGLRWRAYSPATARIASMVGAVPVVVQASELHAALATGVVNSYMSSSATGYDSRTYESIRNWHDTQAWLPKNAVIVNLAAFNALDSVTQNALLSAAADAQARGWRLSEEKNAWYVAQLRTKGMNIVQPTAQLRSDLKKIGETMLADWLGKAGADGQAVVDAFRR